MASKYVSDKAVSVLKGLRLRIPIGDAKGSTVYVALTPAAAKGLSEALNAYVTRSGSGLNDSAAFPGTVELKTDADILAAARRLL